MSRVIATALHELLKLRQHGNRMWQVERSLLFLHLNFSAANGSDDLIGITITLHKNFLLYAQTQSVLIVPFVAHTLNVFAIYLSNVVAF